MLRFTPTNASTRLKQSAYLVRHACVSQPLLFVTEVAEEVGDSITPTSGTCHKRVDRNVPRQLVHRLAILAIASTTPTSEP